MTTLHVYAWRSGMLGFADRKRDIPEGAIAFFSGPKGRVVDAVEGSARLSRADNRTLYVPGIPEAQSDEEALQALWAYEERLTASVARRPRRNV